MQTFLKRAVYILLPALILSFALLAIYALALTGGADTVTYSFLIGFPMIAGAVILHFQPQGGLRRFWTGVVWIVAVVVLSIALSFILGLEGLICIAMAAGPILFGALLGGVFYVAGLRWFHDINGPLKAVVAPILVLIGLGYIQAPPRTYTISNTIIINAAPADVFAILQNIPDISPQEIPTQASHWLGIPKPTSAVWEDNADGAVRHSYWGEGIHFREHITHFEKDKLIAWDFAFPEGWIVDGIQDPHITVGGPYFNVLSGSYSLSPHDGGTRLTLTTRTFDGSQLGAYAKFWHYFFFEDFHAAILHVVKNRAEA